MGKVIGIDLGTTNSVVAIHEGKETKVIVNSEGSRLTPSIVGFTDDGRVVGRAAKAQATTNPTRTVASIKRFVGRTHNEVGSEEKIVPYKVVGAEGEPVQVEIDGKKYYPAEISAMVLQDLKKSAELYLGHPVTAAVITVPAYFNDAQRQATKEAGKIAGLDVKRIINEPTAAALAYGMEKMKNEKILVFDLGGGTFDVSILDVCDGLFEVLSTNGDTHLGGDDWDRMLVDHIADEFQKSNGVDLRKDPMALQRLTEAAEKAKCELSAVPQTAINLPYITADASGPKHLQHTITRAKFESICEPLFVRIRGPVVQAMKDAGLDASAIAQVVFVGGSTRMPKCSEICKEIFGKDPHRGVNPDEVVAVGAAIQGAIIAGDVHDIVLLDVTPLSLGVETMGGVMTPLIARNTTIPTRKSEVYTTASDGQPAVDIHVLQGERKMAKDCRTLGRFQLTGLPPVGRGVPQIEVSFDIDVNGIISVSAKDKSTDKMQKIEIKASSGMDKSEVDRLIEEAAANEAEDKKQAELIELRNKADNLCYRVEKMLSECGKRIEQPLKDAAEAGMKAVRDAMSKNEAAAIEAAMKTLDDPLDKIGKKLYENPDARPPQATAPAPAAVAPVAPAGPPKPPMQEPGGEVVEVDFESTQPGQPG